MSEIADDIDGIINSVFIDCDYTGNYLVSIDQLINSYNEKNNSIISMFSDVVLNNLVINFKIINCSGFLLQLFDN